MLKIAIDYNSLFDVPAYKREFTYEIFIGSYVKDHQGFEVLAGS